MVNKVDDQTLDMRPISILIRHDHYRSISQTFQILILFADLQTNNLQ